MFKLMLGAIYVLDISSVSWFEAVRSFVLSRCRELSFDRVGDSHGEIPRFVQTFPLPRVDARTSNGGCLELVPFGWIDFIRPFRSKNIDETARRNWDAGCGARGYISQID
jgi:hypothetical protein